MLVAACSVGLCASGAPRTIDLTGRFDATTPLPNPHKGWYHHYFDNGIAKYLPKQDSDLTDIPGMDHLYLRLAWAYLEPREGQFTWKVIDDVIEKWTARGMGISFRISCKETGTRPIEQQFATPKWVMEAGAKGGHYARHKEPGDPKFPWEPVYDDPVYLAKLENFIRAFAARYDGKPWLRYVDVGSLGDWGEGHTSSGSRKYYDGEARLKHLKIHVKHFKKSLLVVSDDLIYGAKDKEGIRQLHQFVVDHGISYRDDSILVEYWIGRAPRTYSVMSTGFFDDVHLKHPTVLELQHLRIALQKGTWEGKPGTVIAKHGGNGPDFMRGAVRAMRATYLGYHGDARQWMSLPENPKLSNELLNLCGYWYFPHRVTLPSPLVAGKANRVSIAWENRGVAPAYHPYKLMFRLKGMKTATMTVDAGNMKWVPDKSGRIHDEAYTVTPPGTLAPGAYELAFKLRCEKTKRDVFMALDPALRDNDGLYAVGKIDISR
jgi:hypothetical protein